MQDTVTIKILRSAFIETNHNVALIRLDSMEHKVGQPVMVSYYNTDGDVEYLVALGTKNGVGKDCYSIISTSKEEVINGVVETLPDVSEVVNDAVYISKYEDEWSKVYIWNNVIKRVDPLDKTKSLIFKDLETGFRWFWSVGKFYREDDFVSQQEIQDRFESLRMIKTFNVEFQRGPVQLKGTELLEPVLRISILEGARDITDLYTYKVKSTAHGSQETIKSIENNIMILYKTIDVTATYTITATKKGTEEDEVPETLETTCDIVFVPYTLYKTSKTDNIDTLQSITSYSQVLWGGKEDLTLEFNEMDLDYTVILIPEDLGIPSRILDKHGLDYIDDYTIENIIYSGESYNILIKKDAISMNGSFKQVLKYE